MANVNVPVDFLKLAKVQTVPLSTEDLLAAIPKEQFWAGLSASYVFDVLFPRWKTADAETVKQQLEEFNALTAVYR